MIDEPESVNQIRKYIAPSNGEYVVTGTRTIPEAIKLLNKDKQYDLVLLDLQYQKGRTSICKKIIDQTTSPVVLLTALDNIEEIVNILNMGCRGFIKKPVKSSRLVFRIKEILSEVEDKSRGLL